MAWGGRRENSGRKRNPYRTAEAGRKIAQRASEDPTGLYKSPLDFLITVMQSPEHPIELRVDCAKAAAPYVHAKLQSIDITSEEDRRLEIVFTDFRSTIQGGTAAIPHSPLVDLSTSLALPVAISVALDDDDDE